MKTASARGLQVCSTLIVKIRHYKTEHWSAIRILLPLLLGLLIFLIFYYLASHLPLLADSCFHTFTIEEIADKGTLSIDTEFQYPLFYHLFGTSVYFFMGLSGIKLIAPLMIALSSLLAYLIARELTKSEFIALVSILLTGFSTKVIFYGTEITLEPFTIFFILLAIYSALLLYRKQNLRTAILASFLTGMAISTKQQALFLLVALPVFFLINRVRVKKFLAFLGLVVLFASGPYLAMWTSIGGLFPSSSTGSIFHYIPDSGTIHTMKEGSLLDRMRFMVVEHDVPEWSEELDEESNGFELLIRGTREMASKNIYIWEMINPIRFVELNSLQGYYPSWPSGWMDSPFLHKVGFVFLQILFISGFITSLAYAVRNKRWRIVPVIVFISWLFASTTGVDTKRYFLYLPVFMAFMYPLTLKLAFQRFKPIKHKVLPAFLVFLTFVSAFYLIQGCWDQGSHVKELARQQAGTLSKGGIASVEEVGLWLKENTLETDKLFNFSYYEWTYYANRETWYDFRVLFLEEDRIDYYLREVWDIKYVIVQQNQVVSDDSWKHVGTYPQSFYDKIRNVYGPPVYTSSYEDIWVYQLSDRKGSLTLP